MKQTLIALVIGTVVVVVSSATKAEDLVQVEARIVSDSVAEIREVTLEGYGRSDYETELELILADKTLKITVRHPSRHVPDIWTEIGTHLTLALPTERLATLLSAEAAPFPPLLMAGEVNVVERKTKSSNVGEAAKARETLLTYFEYLRSGQYEKAVTLFEPWEEGVGSQHSSWEGLAGFSPREERNSKAKVLMHSCGRITCSLRPEVLSDYEVAEGQYMFRVQFFNKDGTEVVLGGCCGVEDPPEEQNYMPPPGRRGWPHYVHKINGRYVVRTPPIYEP